MLVSSLSSFSEASKRKTKKKTNHAALSQSTDWRTVAKNPSNNSPREATASWRSLEPRVSPAGDAVQRLVLRQTDFTFTISHLGDWRSSRKDKWLLKIGGGGGRGGGNHDVVGGFKSDKCQQKAQRNYQHQATVQTLMLLKNRFPFSLKKEHKIFW